MRHNICVSPKEKMHFENLKSRVFLANVIVFVLEVLLAPLWFPEPLVHALPFVAAFSINTLLHLVMKDLRLVAGFSFAVWVSAFYVYLYSARGITPTLEQAVFIAISTILIALTVIFPRKS